MSSSNRSRVFIGFGVLAIVLIAAIAYWPAKFRSEEASGAIGAVQKHRAPQISQNDVILGNETTRAKQDVQYRDFFNDAAKLQSISAALASAASPEQAASVSRELADLEAQLQSRYASRMNAALNSLELQAKQMNNAKLQEEAMAMESRMQSRQLAAADMEMLNSRLAELFAMESKTASRSMLQDADADLGRAFAELNSRSGLTESALQNVAQELNQRVELNSISEAEQSLYFSRLQSEAKALMDVEQALASRDMAASRLADETMELADAADQLESAALQNLDAYLSSRSAMASALADMEAQLASRMQSRDANAMYSRQLSSIQQALNARDTEFRARAAADIDQALSSFQSYADSRLQYSRLANGQQLQASTLASRQMQSRELYSRLANTANLQSRLSNLQAQLANQALASRLSNQSQLSSRCADLQSRLASRAQ